MGNKKSKLNENNCKQDKGKCDLKRKVASIPELGQVERKEAEVPFKLWYAYLPSEVNHNFNSEVDILEEQNRRDVEKVLAALKTCNFKRFCIVLKSEPFIQHWRVFEEAVDNDATFCKVNAKGKITNEHQSFTLRLMDQGYNITERELELMEMRLNGYSKLMFKALKNHIIGNYLVRMRSLQELCRRSLKMAYRDRHYVRFVKSLNYPEALKDFLLKVS